MPVVADLYLWFHLQRHLCPVFCIHWKRLSGFYGFHVCPGLTFFVWCRVYFRLHLHWPWWFDVCYNPVRRWCRRFFYECCIRRWFFGIRVDHQLTTGSDIFCRWSVFIVDTLFYITADRCSRAVQNQQEITIYHQITCRVVVLRLLRQSIFHCCFCAMYRCLHSQKRGGQRWSDHELTTTWFLTVFSYNFICWEPLKSDFSYICVCSSAG